MAGGTAVAVNGSNFVQDVKTGLYVPRVPGDAVFHYRSGPLNRGGGYLKSGVVVKRDETTGIWEVPGYGTGEDDYVMRAIVRGNIRNIGISPVPDAGLSSLVAKMQAMASTWEVLLTGRKTPVKAASDIVSFADDSDVGIGGFVSNYIGALLTENRGAFVSYVPLDKYEFSKWSEHGMRAIPLEKQEGDLEPRYYYLDMESDDYRNVRGLWTVDGLDCYPTGNAEWPFWVRQRRNDKSDAWVLIHRDFGTQITYQIGGKDKTWAGYGQSPTWRYINILVQEIMRAENDIEAMLNRPPDGIVQGSGLDVPEQLADAVRAHNDRRAEGEVLYYPGTMFMGSVSPDANLRLLEFTRPPAGYNFETWKVWREDMLALTFNVSAAWVVTRIGTGSLTQSGITQEIAATTGLAHLRTMIQAVLSSAIPPRVFVHVHYRSDRQTRFQIETANTLATAIATLQTAGEGETLSVAEIRALVEHYGLDIPTVTDDMQTGTVGDARVIVDGPNDDSDEGVEEQINAGRPEDGLALSDLLSAGISKDAIPVGARVRCGNAFGTLIEILDANTVLVQHEWHKYTFANSVAYSPSEVFLAPMPKV